MEPERIARSNADDAYQAIRRFILTVEMPPGAAFTEQEMVRRVGFGKTPVREALLRLKLERLVEVQARSGYRVAPVTLKDVRDACRLMGYLEAGAAQAIAADPLAGARLDPLETVLGQHAPDGGDSWIRGDWQFHNGVARAQENHRQAEVMLQLGQAVLRFRHLALVLGVPAHLLAHDHQAFLEAIRRGDGVAASATSLDLWRDTQERLLAVLAATDSVLSTNVWSTRDKNAFYLDAVPPGPSIPDVFRGGAAADDARTPASDTTRSPAADMAPAP